MRQAGAQVPTPLAAGKLEDPPGWYSLLPYIEGDAADLRHGGFDTGNSIVRDQGYASIIDLDRKDAQSPAFGHGHGDKRFVAAAAIRGCGPRWSAPWKPSVWRCAGKSCGAQDVRGTNPRPGAPALGLGVVEPLPRTVPGDNHPRGVGLLARRPKGTERIVRDRDSRRPNRRREQGRLGMLSRFVRESPREHARNRNPRAVALGRLSGTTGETFRLSPVPNRPPTSDAPSSRSPPITTSRGRVDTRSGPGTYAGRTGLPTATAGRQPRQEEFHTRLVPSSAAARGLAQARRGDTVALGATPEGGLNARRPWVDRSQCRLLGGRADEAWSSAGCRCGAASARRP